MLIFGDRRCEFHTRRGRGAAHPSSLVRRAPSSHRRCAMTPHTAPGVVVSLRSPSAVRCSASTRPRARRRLAPRPDAHEREARIALVDTSAAYGESEAVIGASPHPTALSSPQNSAILASSTTTCTTTRPSTAPQAPPSASLSLLGNKRIAALHSTRRRRCRRRSRSRRCARGSPRSRRRARSAAGVRRSTRSAAGKLRSRRVRT